MTALLSKREHNLRGNSCYVGVHPTNGGGCSFSLTITTDQNERPEKNMVQGAKVKQRIQTLRENSKLVSSREHARRVGG